MSLRGVAFPHKMFVYQQTNEAFTKDESLSTSKPRLRNSKVFRDTTNFRLNATNPIHKSEAVSKRKMELDQLRKRSLTKENATRLKNAEAPCELNLDNFAERQRKNVRLEKEKLREAKSFLNNYRADENKLSKFTESRRRSLEEERAQLEQARKYLNHYHGAEVSPFSQRRRKSLLLEKANQREAKDYMNNYRSDGTLPTSSRKISSRRHSTGSIKKQSRASSSAKKSLTPKQLFAPMEDRNPLEETSNRHAEGKKEKTVTGEPRELCFDNPESLLTKMLDCNQPPVSQLEVEGGSGDEQKYDNGSMNLPQKALQQENIAIENMPTEGSNNSDEAGSHSDFLTVLLGLDSSSHNNEEHKILMAMGSNDNCFLDCNVEIPISSNEKNEQDPYSIDDDGCALSCEPAKSCFGCNIM